MTAETATRSVVMEKEFPYAPEKVWRALTESDLMEQWLMKNDFQPEVGHAFKLTADWGAVECKVLAMEPGRMIAYTWAAYGLESVVTWTLTPVGAGTHLRMEHSGFKADQEQAYKGAGYGWQRFMGELERVVGGL